MKAVLKKTQVHFQKEKICYGGNFSSLIYLGKQTEDKLKSISKFRVGVERFGMK